jgi:uncharacterized protein (DUF2147 family)
MADPGQVRQGPHRALPGQARPDVRTTSWIKDASKTQDVNNPDPALKTRPLLGQPVIRDFKQAAPGRWTGGKIYDPKTGKTYDSKLTANANGSLKVQGCVLFVCQAQTWTHN